MEVEIQGNMCDRSVPSHWQDQALEAERDKCRTSSYQTALMVAGI